MKQIGKIQNLRTFWKANFSLCFINLKGEEFDFKKSKILEYAYSDILEAKNVWEEMVKTVSNGEIVKEVTEKGIRKTYFPKKRKQS